MQPDFVASLTRDRRLHLHRVRSVKAFNRYNEQTWSACSGKKEHRYSAHQLSKDGESFPGDLRGITGVVADRNTVQILDVRR